MSPAITAAIRNRQVIRLDYEPGARLIEPHCLGYSSEGNQLLRAFQRSGASASHESVDWKLFRVDRIRSLSVSEEQFDGPRPGYNPADQIMKGGIIACL